MNAHGIIPENTLVENNDIIIGKVIPIRENRSDHTKLIKYEDQSISYRTIEDSYIDKNFVDRNGDGYNLQFIPESPSSGPLANQVGRVSLDGGREIADAGNRQTLQDVHKLRYGS